MKSENNPSVSNKESIIDLNIIEQNLDTIIDEKKEELEIKIDLRLENEVFFPKPPKNKEERKNWEKKEAKKYWKQVGWHRPLAGFWFNYAIVLVIALPGLLIMGVVIPKILPYPEALGFATVATNLLMPIYLFADFGIKEAVTRYIGQYAEIEPRRALRYMSFYFYFQMFSGIIQITIISALAVTIIPQTDIAYASWLFLAFILIQWPGTCGLYIAALGGFQQFDKQNLITILQNVAIQSITQVGFILLGRNWGANNPEIGELMGATAGYILGTWLDDFIAIFVGMYFFKKTIEPFGIPLKEAFYLSFDREIIREVITYGGKVLPSGLSFVLVNALITGMLVSWLNNYATWMGVYYIANGIIGALSISFSSAGPISETYNNGKKEMTLYLIRQQFRWWGILSIGVFMAPILYLIPSIIALAAPEYSPIKWMVFPLLLGAIILFPSIYAGFICQAADLPAHATYMNFIEQGTRLLTYLIVLAPWGFRTWFGEETVIYGWLFAEAPAYAAKGIYGWFIIKKRLFPEHKIQIPYYQTFVAPAISMIPLFPISVAMEAAIVPIYNNNEIAGFGMAALYVILLIYIFPMFLIMPLYGWLGAWDDKSLDDLRKASLMSGPSKKLVKIIYKSAKWGHDHSPFKGKFLVPYKKAIKEADEIIELREKNELKAKLEESLLENSK